MQKLMKRNKKVMLKMKQLKIIKRKNNESDKEYCHRVASYHDELTWQNIADICNKELKTNKTADAYRKADKNYNNQQNTIINTEDDLSNVLLEMRKERVKLSDERSQTNALIRRMSREDTIKEIAECAADSISCRLPLQITNPKKGNSKKEAILEISDWHYGIDIKNYWNTYNPDIAKERIAKLRDETINILKKENITKLHIVNMGDMISGRIHTQIRINNRIDAITQIIEVSELVAQFISDLSKVANIEYYDTLDNHSRLEPNLKESLELESLTRVTTWYLKERLKNYTNIHINQNTYGDDIITFSVLGHKVVAVHGDKDKPNKVIDRMCMVTANHYDLVCMAHLHHFSAEEKNMCRMVCNGSMMGTDDFAERLRLTSKPSQNLIISSETNVTECIYVIDLD